MLGKIKVRLYNKKTTNKYKLIKFKVLLSVLSNQVQS